MHVLVHLFDDILKLFLFQLGLIEVHFNLASDTFYFIEQVVEHFLLAELLLLKEGADDVFGLLLILEGDVKEVPVLDNEQKMISDSDLVSDQDSFVVNRSHDSNQDVQQTNKHDKDRDVEKEYEIVLVLLVFTVGERFNIDFSKAKFGNVQDRSQNVFVRQVQLFILAKFSKIILVLSDKEKSIAQEYTSNNKDEQEVPYLSENLENNIHKRWDLILHLYETCESIEHEDHDNSTDNSDVM